MIRFNGQLEQSDRPPRWKACSKAISSVSFSDSPRRSAPDGGVELLVSGRRCRDASMSLQPGTPVLYYLLYMPPDIRPSRLGHLRRLFLLLDTVQQLIRPGPLSAHPDPPTSIRSPPLHSTTKKKKRKEIVSPRFSSTNEMEPAICYRLALTTLRPASRAPIRINRRVGINIIGGRKGKSTRTPCGKLPLTPQGSAR